MMTTRLVLVILTALATAAGLSAMALFAQGSALAGLLASFAAIGAAFLTARGLAARARARRASEASREQAFLEAARRSPR
jgi:hypothetical protein